MCYTVRLFQPPPHYNALGKQELPLLLTCQEQGQAHSSHSINLSHFEAGILSVHRPPFTHFAGGLNEASIPAGLEVWTRWYVCRVAENDAAGAEE